jgi:hypothetical protein
MRGSSLIRRGLGVAGIATLALGLTAAGAAGNQGKAKHYGKLAAKQCAMERKALGGQQAFVQVYGKPAMPHCIGVTKPEVRQDARNANRDCRTERQAGLDAFRDQYGTNRNKRNAWGKCVSSKTAAALRQDRQDVVNAAKQCKAERSDPDFAAGHDGKSFQQFYGKNKNGKNAFGKCVSAKAKAADGQSAG